MKQNCSACKLDLSMLTNCALLTDWQPGGNSHWKCNHCDFLSGEEYHVKGKIRRRKRKGGQIIRPRLVSRNWAQTPRKERERKTSRAGTNGRGGYNLLTWMPRPGISSDEVYERERHGWQTALDLLLPAFPPPRLTYLLFPLPQQFSPEGDSSVPWHRSTNTDTPPRAQWHSPPPIALQGSR